MKTKILLRIASAITLLYCAGHTSGIPWTPGESEEAKLVVTSMKETQFNSEGVISTYWNFYYGFGLIISLFLLCAAVVLWQLGSIASSSPATIRPAMISFFICFAVNAIFSWQYFFALPAIFALMISVLIVLAFVASFRKTDIPVITTQ